MTDEIGEEISGEEMILWDLSLRTFLKLCWDISRFEPRCSYELCFYEKKFLVSKAEWAKDYFESGMTQCKVNGFNVFIFKIC